MSIIYPSSRPSQKEKKVYLMSSKGRSSEDKVKLTTLPQVKTEIELKVVKPSNGDRVSIYSHNSINY